MKHVAIGIGGTGARCVEALVHLCAVGLGPDDLYILLVDPDKSNGNVTRAKRTIEDYVRCRNAISPVGSPERPKTFGTRLHFDQDHGLPWSPFTPDMDLGKLFRTDDQQFRDHRSLCRAFYSDVELALTWGAGFRGHASVASAAMTTVKQHLDRPPWSDLLSQTKNAVAGGDQRTFVFSSVFGATGAGGFPAIAQVLRNRAAEDSDQWVNRKDCYGIGGALLLPYLMFTPTRKSEEGDEPYARASHFLINTQAALLHYGRAWSRDGSPFDNVYYVGTPQLDQIDRTDLIMRDEEDPEDLGGGFSPGGPLQKNPAHIVEMLAALAALDFYNKRKDFRPFSEATDTKRQCRMYALAGSDPGAITWEDLPKLPVNSHADQTYHCQERLLVWTTMMSALTDHFLPRLHDREFEDNRDTAAWYTRHFRPGSLTDGPALAGLDAIGSFARRRYFRWAWQWHQTSQRQVRLFNHSFLQARADRVQGTPSDQAQEMASMILHSGLDGVKSGSPGHVYATIWDFMCNDKNPGTNLPVGKFWDMMYRAATDYVNHRYSLVS